MPHQCIECDRTFPDGSKEMLTGCPDCGGNKFQFRPERSADPASDTAGSTSDHTPEPTSDHTPKSTSDPPTAAGDVSTGIDEPATATDDSSTSTSPTTTDPIDSVTARDDLPEDRSVVTDQVDSTDSTDSTDTTDDTVNRSALSDVPPDSSGTEDSDDATSHHDATSHYDDATSDVDVSEDSAQASARSDVVTRDELDRVREDPTKPDEPTDTSQRPGVDGLRKELNDQFESIKILSPGQYELNLMELYDRQEYIISLKEDGRYVIEMPGTWGDTE